jgi:ribosome maturation factor RimP
MIALLEEVKEKLIGLATPLCQKLSVDLVELNVRRQGGEIAIQILADRPMGGITIEECTLINRGMIDAIDATAVLPPEEYSVEVSSPGLDRPMKTRKDFLRVVNQEIRFMLNGPWQGKQEYTGVLTEITDTAVVVSTEKYGIIEIPMDKIFKGYVVL